MEPNTEIKEELSADSQPAPKQKRGAAVYIILAVIILAQLAYTIFCFETKKKNSYGDEIWSYGLANSYYKPFLYLKEGVWMRDETPELFDNYGEWVDGEVVKDYITVQPGERFTYGSVISNQELDNHPPFYYMLLHTVCSFFPDKFSFRYAFGINCVLLIINSIFIFKLGELILGSDKKGLLFTAFYAASTGGLSTFIFTRQYSLLTTLVVCFTYFTAKLFYAERTADKGDMTALRKTLPFIMLTGFLAFGTHYFAIAFAGLLTFFMCVTFACKRKIKKMFIYGAGVLASLLLFVAVFPAMLKHIFSESTVSGTDSMGDAFELRYLTSILLRYSVGLKISLFETDSVTYVIVGVVLFLAVAVPLGFAFRKEKWFRPVKERLKAAGSYYAGAVTRPNFFVTFLMIDVAVVTAIISKVTQVYYFRTLITRYIFLLMPFVSLFFLLMIDKLLGVSKHITRFILPISAVICAALCVRMHINWGCPYYMESVGSMDESAALLEGKNCLIVLDNDDNLKLIEAFPPYIYTADNFFCLMPKYMVPPRVFAKLE